jgi:gas vesicle protein
MRRLLSLLFFGFFAIFFYNRLDNLGYLNPDHLFAVSLCDHPISYKIGTFDPKFGITKEEFSSDIRKATAVWEKSYQKPLFVFDTNAPLTINLVYDSRQQLSNQINKLQDEVQNNQDKLKDQAGAYEDRVTDFRKRIIAFNKTVADWNAKGGAPEDVYQQLKAEEQDLRKEADSLNAEAQKLHQTTQDYNGEVTQLNQTIDNFKETIQSKPEEGVFNGPENTITIYFSNSKDEFIHTLAHELGHARGLDHNFDPQSIMYPYTTTTLLTSAEDRASLEEYCRPRSIFEVAGYNLAVFINQHVNQTRQTPG